MSTIKLEVQLSSEDLLKAVQQLSVADLEKFVSQVIAIQAQRKATNLPQVEAELLLKINPGIPVNIQKRYEELISKRLAETLTTDEYEELLQLTEQVEELQAKRIDYLAELARLRGVSLTALMEKLGIRIPDYV